MEQNYISTSIPIELRQYQKTVETIKAVTENKVSSADFGVKIVTNSEGNVSEAHYYSDTGDLLKKIFYKGSSVSRIEYYRYKKIRSEEIYSAGKIHKKTIYNRAGEQVSIISYEYNKKNTISAIKKSVKNRQYAVIYGYDELGRANSRTLKLNEIILETQKFRYDILDRIVEYSDSNQTIKVYKINTDNELISYTITDKIGNNIEITNKFFCSEYLGTDIDLNGHKTTVEDRIYLDNVMLKKPYPSEDDMDLAMSAILNQNNVTPIKKEHDNDVLEELIQQKLKQHALPITVRKMQLINQTG